MNDSDTEDENPLPMNADDMTTIDVETININSTIFLVGHFSNLSWFLHLPQQHPQKVQQKSGKQNTKSNANVDKHATIYGITICMYWLKY